MCAGPLGRPEKAKMKKDICRKRQCSGRKGRPGVPLTAWVAGLKNITTLDVGKWKCTELSLCGNVQDAGFNGYITRLGTGINTREPDVASGAMQSLT